MVQGIRHFEKDDGRKLPVSDDFLLPFLSPTSPGTNYWDPPPSGPMTQRQRARAVLQLHQALSMFRRCGVNFRGKKFLDIGTGNGMLPRMMLEFSEIEAAIKGTQLPARKRDTGTPLAAAARTSAASDEPESDERPGVLPEPGKQPA